MYETSKAMVSINPFTGKQIELWPHHNGAQVDELLERAQHDAQAWSSVSIQERAQGLRSLADALEQRAEALAQTLTAEVGKPISESRSELAKCVEVCRFYAAKAPDLLRPTPAPTEAAGSHVRYDPLGVIFAVMPWNFPFWQVMRFAAPALMAGNALIFKHAPNTQGCAQGIITALAASVLPTGLLQLVRVPVERVEA
ncbi:MAG TPA: NADP-dependent succinic semialdehyde dehydrogenase, partial [Myxococcales bacterium]|nr:NADP-dependent succinic semialdehyde dehydrogenase [Myxococcales bacterium]